MLANLDIINLKLLRFPPPLALVRGGLNMRTAMGEASEEARPLKGS
jgi:hypothetical protein